MITIGQTLPSFNLTAVHGTDPKTAFKPMTDKDHKGKWKVFVFWPKDFTFVCPTEIVAYGKLNNDFKDRDAVLLGVSTDSDFVHLAWRQHHEDLKNCPYPWLADIKKEFSQALGVLDQKEGVALRATVIADPDNVIQHISVNNLNVGRNPDETLRILDALQTDELCPCNWQKGEETIHI